jgi:hypothetical protein
LEAAKASTFYGELTDDMFRGRKFTGGFESAVLDDWRVSGLICRFLEPKFSTVLRFGSWVSTFPREVLLFRGATLLFFEEEYNLFGSMVGLNFFS